MSPSVPKARATPRLAAAPCPGNAQLWGLFQVSPSQGGCHCALSLCSEQVAAPAHKDVPVPLECPHPQWEEQR